MLTALPLKHEQGYFLCPGQTLLLQKLLLTQQEHDGVLGLVSTVFPYRVKWRRAPRHPAAGANPAVADTVDEGGIVHNQRQPAAT